MDMASMIGFLSRPYRPAALHALRSRLSATRVRLGEVGIFLSGSVNFVNLFSLSAFGMNRSAAR